MVRSSVLALVLLSSACHNPENAPPPSTPSDGASASASPPAAPAPVSSASAPSPALAPSGLSEPAASSSNEPGGRMVGGYTDAAVDQPDVVATANRAVQLLQERSGDKQLKLVRVVRAEKQVVAGLNTRLSLVVNGSKGERTVTVVVFRDLKRNESLAQVEGM